MLIAKAMGSFFVGVHSALTMGMNSTFEPSPPKFDVELCPVGANRLSCAPKASERSALRQIT